jgi:hypothetical protein
MTATILDPTDAAKSQANTIVTEANAVAQNVPLGGQPVYPSLVTVDLTEQAKTDKATCDALYAELIACLQSVQSRIPTTRFHCNGNLRNLCASTIAEINTRNA